MIRRRFLTATGLALLSLAGCGPGAPPPALRPLEPDLPPLKKVDTLTDLCALAGLRWLLITRPRDIAAQPFLIPAIGKVVTEENFSRFSSASGIDLRQAREAVIVSYAMDAVDGATAPPDVLFYLVRHAGNAQVVERAFRQRLVSDEKRIVERPDLVRVSGNVASRPQAMVVLGPDIVGYQHGGDLGRGPARIAALYATERLKRSPTAMADPAFRSLSARLGPAPVRAFARGPFEGELARGARGLLAGATAIGAVARPSVREGIAVVVAVAGDFAGSAEPASQELLEAYREIASGSFGRLLALDAPITPPLATHSAEAVSVAVELHPGKLAEGLRAATSAQIDTIMR